MKPRDKIGVDDFKKALGWFSGKRKAGNFPDMPGEVADLIIKALECVDLMDGAVFHYFDCNDGDGNGCGLLRQTMGKIATSIGYDNGYVDTDILEASRAFDEHKAKWGSA